MSVIIVSGPEKWIHKTVGNCYHEYNKIFTIQASSRGDVIEWSTKYSRLDHMRTHGNCGDTSWAIQQGGELFTGELFAVRFWYNVDSSD